jgi:hypothetical protein
LVYLVPTLVFSVTVHYCGGKLVSISANPFGEGKCSCGSEKKMKDCCKTKTFKLNNIKNIQQKISENIVDFRQYQNTHLTFVTLETHTHPCSILESRLLKHPPPDNQCRHRYLINRIFRI